MKGRTNRKLLDISKAELKRVQHVQQELVCGGNLTADRDEWRKECRDFGSIRYGNTANGQDEQKQRVRRHEDLLEKAKEERKPETPNKDLEQRTKEVRTRLQLAGMKYRK